MKKISFLLFLVFILSLSSCDDGDVQVSSIDFSAVTVQKCSEKDIFYKIKDNEILILEMPLSNLPIDETIEGTPREVALSSSTKVTYRQYTSTISLDIICPQVPDASIALMEEWIATTGTIQITTTAIKTINADTGGTKITGYKHNIIFKNITFQKPNGNQVYTEFQFGSYNTNITPLALNFGEEVTKSTCNTKLYNISGSEALILDVTNFNTLFENTVTTSPRIAYINTDNELMYKLFSGAVNDTYLCANPTPLSPSLLQEWNAENGVENVSGIIEVTTSVYGTGFQHTIHLKNVTMRKGNSTFLLATDFLYGNFIRNN